MTSLEQSSISVLSFRCYPTAREQTYYNMNIMAFLRDLSSVDESKKAHAPIFGGENGEEPHHHPIWTNEAVASAAAFADKMPLRLSDKSVSLLE